MIHRHLDVPPDVPVERLPLVAIADTLERGDLQDWQPLARAIRGDPFGRLATAVARLVDAYPRYGTSPLWRAWIDRCRVRAAAASAVEHIARTAQHDSPTSAPNIEVPALMLQRPKFALDRW